MSALIEMLIDYAHADVTVPKLFKASQIDDRTKLSLDFLDPQTYANGAVPALAPNGQVFSDLTDIGGTVSLVAPAPLAVNAAGLKFSGVQGQYIDLGDRGKFGANTIRFGFGGWVKNRDNTNDPNTYAAIGGYLSNTQPANCQWVIQRPKASNTYSANVSGAGATITLAVDEVAHIFFVARVMSGIVIIQAYKNGVLANTGNAFTLPNGVLPTPAVAARIGQSVAYSQSCNAELGSWDMQDFGEVGAVGSTIVADFLARAYGDNVGRFA